MSLFHYVNVTLLEETCRRRDKGMPGGAATRLQMRAQDKAFAAASDTELQEYLKDMHEFHEWPSDSPDSLTIEDLEKERKEARERLEKPVPSPTMPTMSLPELLRDLNRRRAHKPQ